MGVFIIDKTNPQLLEPIKKWFKELEFVQTSTHYLELILSFLDTIQQKLSSITSLFSSDSLEKETGQILQPLDRKLEDYKPPKPVFTSMVEKKEVPAKEVHTEIRVNKEKKDKREEMLDVTEKPQPSPSPLLPSPPLPSPPLSSPPPSSSPPKKETPKTQAPESLKELEKICGQTATKAVASYQKAISALQDYNRDVIKVVESGDNAVSHDTWKRLKEATEKRRSALKEAEELGTSVLDSLKQMYYLIDEPKFDAPAAVKSAARKNIKKILDDLDGIKKKFDDELERGNINEHFFKQVKNARENFDEELHILFPSINLEEKKLSIKEDAFDLFVVYMYNKVTYLQRELEKLQTLHAAKVKAALRASGDNLSEEMINELLRLRIEEEKRAMEEDFSKKLLEKEKQFDEDLRRQLKLYSQINADHLREVLQMKEDEMSRKMERALSEQAEAESMKYKAQQAPIIGRLRGLEAAMKARIEEEKGASNAQLLWSACMALVRAVKATSHGAAEPAIRPLEAEIKAISKAAPNSDPLVRAAINGIPPEASKRGVYPEDALRKKFLDVEKQARKLALVPEEGAALPIHILSYIQSALIVDAAIPKQELEDGPIDAASLNTYDILKRARYWMDRGDFKMTLRYMNLLKGAPRCVAREWMNETRILLETLQAIDTLMAYAGVAGLKYASVSESPKLSTGQ